MTVDLDSLCWKIYERTACPAWQIETALRLTALHLRERGWIEAANHLASPIAPRLPKPAPATGNPDEFFDKELAVYGDTTNTEQADA